MTRSLRLPILAAALAFALAPAPSEAQPVPAVWQAAGDQAVVTNGDSRFGVACRPGAEGPALVFHPPEGADYGEGFEARLQISSNADAYRIAAGTDIDTFVWEFAREGGAYRAVAANGGAALDATVDSLRAGMNLVVGAAPFERAQRYSLVGSNRAIATVLAGCD